MNNDINLTVIKTPDGPVLGMLQNHVVIYIPAAVAEQLADGIKAIARDVMATTGRPSIVKPPVNFDPKRTTDASQ